MSGDCTVGSLLSSLSEERVFDRSRVLLFVIVIFVDLFMMIIRVRCKNVATNKLVSNWTLYSVPDRFTLHRILDDIHSGLLKPSVDLSWADPESCTFYVTVTSKETPQSSDLQEANEFITIEDISEHNRKIFIQCELKPASIFAAAADEDERETTSTSTSDTVSVPTSSTQSQSQPSKPSIVDVLMRKTNHYPPIKETERMTGNVKQYNTFVKYLIDSKLGVAGVNLADYSNFVNLFCNFLWEIDPHYHKFQIRGKSFPKSFEKFLGFNDPKCHGHKVGNMSMLSIALKLDGLKKFSDRSYMNAAHMQKFKGILQSVIEKCSEYIDILETQRVRTIENHNKSVECDNPNVKDYVTTQIKMNVYISDKKYDSLKEELSNCDYYTPIMISEFVRDRSQSRSTYCRLIQDILTKGVPFKISGAILFHFKLPSQGPHQALHFMWKQPLSDEPHNEQQTKVIFELRSQKARYFSRSMRQEVKQKLSSIANVKPHQALYIMKDLLGVDSASENENSRDIQQRLNIALMAGEDIIVDLRSNNGRKPSFDDFWNIAADYISERTAIDDRRHGTVTENNEVVVNMCLSKSYADMYRKCVKIAQNKAIEKIPSYAWFLCQFWPCSRSASAMLKYTGRFKVKKMIQARLLRKSNPDLHYARAVLKFLRKRAVKYRNCAAFFSADAKCKINVGEPGYPLASVSRGKSVIVGENELFQVADHDFCKLSIIPDGILIHNIPFSIEQHIQEDRDDSDLIASKSCSKERWYKGDAFYGIKTMVFEGSTALRGVVEMGSLLESKYAGKEMPSRFYLITDGGGDRNIVHLSVQKYLIALFRKYKFDELIAIRTAAGCSFYNPVERVHAVANLGLQGVGIMRKQMDDNMESLLKNANSNEEIRKLCDKNPRLAAALKESLQMPVDLLRDVFGDLFMQDTTFGITEPATEEDINSFLEYLDVFDEGIKELRLKAKLSQYSIFSEFLKSHTDAKTYSFHVFKCSNTDCVYHEPLTGKIQPFKQPVPSPDDGNGEHYVEGDDSDEKHLPSKLANIEKQSHNIPFTVSAQTAMNVGMTIVCKECGKPRLLYSKKKLKGREIESFKRMINGIIYVCGSSINEIDADEENRDKDITNNVYARENLNCSSKIEIPYYSCKGYSDICIYCGSKENLESDQKSYSKCVHCKEKPNVNRKKRKILAEDLTAKKKKK